MSEQAPKIYSLEELMAMSLEDLIKLRDSNVPCGPVVQAIIAKKNNSLEGNTFFNGRGYDESTAGTSGIAKAAGLNELE